MIMMASTCTSTATNAFRLTSTTLVLENISKRPLSRIFTSIINGGSARLSSRHSLYTKSNNNINNNINNNNNNNNCNLNSDNQLSANGTINSEIQTRYLRTKSRSSTNRRREERSNDELGMELDELSELSEEEVGKRKKTALILGSSGCLGAAICQHFKTNHDFSIIGADLVPPKNQDSDTVDAFLTLDAATSSSLVDQLVENMCSLYSYNPTDEDNNTKPVLDAIICANGKFSMDPGGGTSSNDIIENAEDDNLLRVHETMMMANYYPVVAAGEIARRFMTLDNGLFIVIGATAALMPTPGMQAYGASKAAAHHYVTTLGTISGVTLSGQHKTLRSSKTARKQRKNNPYLDQMTAIGLLPSILDTPQNRKSLPDDDFNKWTKVDDIAREIGYWYENPLLRPHSGSLVKAVTRKISVENDDIIGKDFKTEFQVVR